MRRHFSLSHHGMLGPSITKRRLLLPRQDVKVGRKNPIFLDNLSHNIRFSIFNRASTSPRQDLFCSRTTISDYISFSGDFNLSFRTLCLVMMKGQVPLCCYFLNILFFKHFPIFFNMTKQNLTIPLELQRSYVILSSSERQFFSSIRINVKLK